MKPVKYVQDCSNSSALVLELLQSFAKPLLISFILISVTGVKVDVFRKPVLDAHTWKLSQSHNEKTSENLQPCADIVWFVILNWLLSSFCGYEQNDEYVFKQLIASLLVIIVDFGKSLPLNYL